MSYSGSSGSGPSRSQSQGEVSQMSMSTSTATRPNISVSEDMGSVLWTYSKYKDFQIVIGDRVLAVHKCVLASRSPVFATMLTSGLTEAQSGQLVIRDFDYDTVNIALRFLYSQRLVKFVNCTSEQICDLMRFGHKYDIQLIIEACLTQIEIRRNAFEPEERKALIKLACSLGSEQIIDLILNFFGAIRVKGKIAPVTSYTCPPYLAIGHALAKEEYFKDMKIFCNGQEFSVHKCILDLTSPIFGQMLDNLAYNRDMSGRLTITRVKPLVVKKAVRLFYTGRIQGKDEAYQNNPDLILGLLEFADRFKVEHLVSLCLQKIQDERARIDKKMITNFIKSGMKFESERILQFMMGILGNPFDMKDASKESYWK